MKKSVLTLALVSLTLAFTSCRDQKTEKETVVKEVEVEKEAETKENKGILERTGEKIDKEVNEEVDKKIDEIGD